MKLSRKRDTEAHEPITVIASTDQRRLGRGRWSTAFLMAGSAILGATAVAVWNRRTIDKMRVQILEDAAKPQQRLNVNEEIF